MKKMTLVIPVVAIALLSGAAFSKVQAESEPKVTTSQKVQEKKRSPEFTAQQTAEARKLVEAHSEKMQPLKCDMYVKMQELKALQNAANPDVAAVSQKATEISQVRVKMQSAKHDMGLALDKAMDLEPGTHNMRNFLGKKGGRGHHMGKMRMTAEHRGSHGQRGYKGFGPHEGRGEHGKRGEHVNYYKGQN